MEKVIEDLDYKYDYSELANGLKLVIFSNPEVAQESAQFIVGAGSNEMAYLKPGIAHFLEHVMFAKADGDWFFDFTQAGADANAYTNFHQTSYYFQTSTNFFENLDALVKMVFTHNITKEVVKKENKIITEEIKMYDNRPDSIISRELFAALSQGSYIHDIAGKIEDINEITPELLIEAFETFYVPNNMILAVVTNKKAKEVISFVQEATKQYQKKEIPSFQGGELAQVRLANQELTLPNLNTMLVSYARKYTSETGLSQIDLLIALEVLNNILTADFNPEFDHLLKSGKINRSFNSCIYQSNDMSFICIDGMVERDTFNASDFDSLFKVDEHLIELGLNKLRGNKVKRASNQMDMIEEIAILMIEDKCPISYYNRLFTITFEELKSTIDKLVELDNKTLVKLKMLK